jgi:hypothetical protein
MGTVSDAVSALSMRRSRRLAPAAAALAAVAALAYLYDPPWAGGVTSGMGAWSADPSGTPFRSTAGRASFFVPANAKALMLPMQTPDVNRTVTVEVRVDDRFLATIQLTHPGVWVRQELPLGPQRTRRRYRRVDLRVDGISGRGIMTGQPAVW